MVRVADLFGRRTKEQTPPPATPLGSAEGRPLKILVRGDCTSHRTVKLNPDLFAQQPQTVQNEKSPFVQFLDAALGLTVPPEHLEAITDVAAMNPVLQAHYRGQAERGVLDETGADLVMLDSWADLNFELHEHRADGYKIWVHPKFLRDPEAFRRDHTPVGRRTLRESVDDAVRLVRLLRRNNPGVPVLFLNQQVDHYPRLPEERVERYKQLGAKVAERVDGVYVGGVIPTELLELDDIGSAGGPGGTLHYQGPTYRRMWDNAAATGLVEAVERRRHAIDTGEPAAVPEPTRPRVEVASGPDREVEVGAPVTIDAQLGPDCTEECRDLVAGAAKVLGGYVTIDGRPVGDTPPRFTPMLIDLHAPEDFAAWEQMVKKFGKGARLRQKRKATEQGYHSHEYHRLLHVPDTHEINHSMDTRSGGEIRDNLKLSVEQLGGAPTELHRPEPPPCPRHWKRRFGVFVDDPEHRQGDVLTGEKLVGLIMLVRRGELALYSQFIGHGDHLRNGVMTLLHHDLVEQMMSGTDPSAAGLTHLMYGGAENGTPELYRFKRQAGFEAHPVDFRTA